MNLSPPLMVAALLVILPDELIVEILSFLEVKSLMRMKCVCKSWKTLIFDPIFVKMHLKKRSARITHLAFLSHNSDHSGDCRCVPISHLLETTSNSITLTDLNYRFNHNDCREIVGSCNGLVCWHGCVGEYHEHSFCFWNPATRTKSETLVSFPCYPKYPNATCKFSFGYDISTDTYKVVVLCLKRDGDLFTIAVRVFTLGDNVWRDIDCFPLVSVDNGFCLLVIDSVYLDNSINWIVHHRYNCHLKNRTIEQFVIISLDLGTETYRQTLLPQSCYKELHDPPTLTRVFPPRLSVLNDCLCFSYDFNKTHFVIWQMKEFGVEESWIQLIKISYLNLQMDYKPRENHIPEMITTPLCVSENGDTLIFAINCQDQAIVYNWRDNRVKRIKSTNGIWWSDAKGYVESLVSTS